MDFTYTGHLTTAVEVTFHITIVHIDGGIALHQTGYFAGISAHTAAKHVAFGRTLVDGYGSAFRNNANLAAAIDVAVDGDLRRSHAAHQQE